MLLDLRNSASGEESEGIATANLFLDHGTITYLQGQKYPRQAFNADPAKDITKLPVAVLVNRGTAGPAEIVAAAILENARGDVVGDKTFGDGSVQKVIEMPDNSALILSVAKYYSPSGKAIQDAAVTPNVLVADIDEDDGGLPDEEQPAAPDEKKEAKPKNQTDDQLNKALGSLEEPGIERVGKQVSEFQGFKVSKLQIARFGGRFLFRCERSQRRCYGDLETWKL